MKKSLCNMPTFIRITISILIFIILYPLKIAVASQYVVIDAEVINIRNNPSLNTSKVIGTTQKGERYALISEKTHVVFANPIENVLYTGGTWYQIKLPNGNLGWVSGSLKFNYKDLSWYTRKSNSGSPLQKETKTFSHKIVIPSQTHALKKSTNVSKASQKTSYIDRPGVIIVGILILAPEILFILGSPSVVVNTAGGDLSAMKAFPWHQKDSEGFSQALRE